MTPSEVAPEPRATILLTGATGFIGGRLLHAIIEIGGGDRVTYAEVMREYARQRKLRRRVIPMPLMSLGASRLLLGVLTPAYGQIAGDMVDSLRNEPSCIAAPPVQPSDQAARPIRVDRARADQRRSRLRGGALV